MLTSCVWYLHCVVPLISKNTKTSVEHNFSLIKAHLFPLTSNIFPLPVATLDETHAELVDKHLTYGGTQEYIDYIRIYIRHLPNGCVMDEKGRPVSWMLTDELCELRMAFTLPEYRKNGFFKALSLNLIHVMRSMDLPIYCQIRQKNQPSINAFTSLGFTPCVNDTSFLFVNEDRF